MGTLTILAALAETCRVVDGAIPLWPHHRERLREARCDDALVALVEHELAAATAAALPGPPTARLRAHVEVSPDRRIRVEVTRALSSLDIVNGPVLVEVHESDLPTRPSSLPGGAKPSDRSWWDEAARVARARGGHQALIVDADGFVVDGSSATVWAVFDGTLVTPPAPPAIAGVARRFVLAHADALKVPLVMRPMGADELAIASEVFLTNAFGGAVGVRDRGGPVTAAARELFARVWTSRMAAPDAGGDEQG